MAVAAQAATAAAAGIARQQYEMNEKPHTWKVQCAVLHFSPEHNLNLAVDAPPRIVINISSAVRTRSSMAEQWPFKPLVGEFESSPRVHWKKPIPNYIEVK